MKRDEKINIIFNEFIENCSSQDLSSIITNELEDYEIIQLLKGRCESTKECILESYGITVK